MNTIGFYARSYIDALTIAFAPASQASASARPNTPAAKTERAELKSSRLARAA
ncbi:MAG: hypothetical protein Q7T44_16345 [Parvibaculum sp.]|nr:hypothetical protein [Parvibaculum sp.]